MAVGSGVERFLDTEEVTGSNPVPPILLLFSSPSDHFRFPGLLPGTYIPLWMLLFQLGKCYRVYGRLAPQSQVAGIQAFIFWR